MSTNERWINDRQIIDQQPNGRQFDESQAIDQRPYDRQLDERQTVVGVFPTRTQAERAIEELHRFGFTDQQIGFIARDSNETARDGTSASETGVAQNTVGGAVSGGVIGGLVGAASSLLIPGFGPAIAGGILAATLGGAALGAVAGGLIGALTQIGVPEDEAYYYQQEFEAGNFLVTVIAPGFQREALEILRRHGAYDASTRRNSQDEAGNRPYAQVGTPPSQAGPYNRPENYNQSGPYNQPGSYNQPGMYDPNSQGGAGNRPYAQAGAYSQPGDYNQPGTYDPNGPQTSNPASSNAPYSPNNPNVDRRPNPDAPDNQNNPY